MTKEYKKRTRSPSYPIFDLKTAIEKAKEFYEVEGANQVPAGIAPVCWGLQEDSSSGYRYISALIQYGIFDDEGSGPERKVFLTDLGKTIVMDEREDSKELQDAIREAALNPDIYEELWEKWHADIPSDANIRFYLVRNLSFNQKKVSRFISNYRSTIHYANLNEPINGDEQLIDETSSDKSEKKPTKQNTDFDTEHSSIELKNTSNVSGDGGRITQFDIVIPLISGDHATLKIPRSLSEEDFELLKTLIDTYLKASKPALTKKLKIEEEGGGTD